MDKIKVLNLYVGIGGNRKLWKDVDVTAIENNPEIAKIYQDFFPNDKVIVGDAHEYLLKHYREFNFIWSSPPCQTHSKARFWASKGNRYPVHYPDMRLYQEILFLDNFCRCKWAVENVVGYYEPFMCPLEIGNHYIWSNFFIENRDFKRCNINNITIKDSVLSGIKISTRKDAILRSMVNPKLGLHIFECAFKIKQQELTKFA